MTDWDGEEEKRREGGEEKRVGFIEWCGGGRFEGAFPKVRFIRLIFMSIV